MKSKLDPRVCGGCGKIFSPKINTQLYGVESCKKLGKNYDSVDVPGAIINHPPPAIVMKFWRCWFCDKSHVTPMSEGRPKRLFCDDECERREKVSEKIREVERTMPAKEEKPKFLPNKDRWKIIDAVIKGSL